MATNLKTAGTGFSSGIGEQGTEEQSGGNQSGKGQKTVSGSHRKQHPRLPIQKIP